MRKLHSSLLTTSPQTKSRKPSRPDDGGQRAVYPVEVPNIFSQIGRLSGRGKSIRLTEQEQLHLHKYILANCEEVMPYERYLYISFIY